MIMCLRSDFNTVFEEDSRRNGYDQSGQSPILKFSLL